MPYSRWFRFALLATSLAACTQSTSVDTNSTSTDDPPIGEAGAGPDDDGGSDDASIDATPADSGGSDGATIDASDDADPCDGVVCDSPPPSSCIGDIRESWSPTGTCHGGYCIHEASTERCEFGCGNGACLDALCVGVSCESPPKPTCKDDSTLTIYDAPGSCSGGICSYGSHDIHCASGCVNDICNGNPCEGIVCHRRPPSYCSGPDTLVMYKLTGSCSGGTCYYQKERKHTCTYGCEAGACKPGPCANVTCNFPPSTSCKDPNTARTRVSSGCSDGKCTYNEYDSYCRHGCVQYFGCRECSVDADCGSGRFCNNYGSCKTCGSATCGNELCECGEANGTCPSDCAPPCPVRIPLGDWSAGDGGWTYDDLWRRTIGGYMVAGSTTNYTGPYTQNLTYGTNLALTSCTEPTLSFRVRLDDDASSTYSEQNDPTDQSERLYVQCSGDGGASWTEMTPSPIPDNQDGCGNCYCAGRYTVNRSFPWTAQEIVVPEACRTGTVRFRFQAKGSNVRRLSNPGWFVDDVQLN